MQSLHDLSPLQREENLQMAAFRTVEKSIKGELKSSTAFSHYNANDHVSYSYRFIFWFDILPLLRSQRPFHSRLARRASGRERAWHSQQGFRTHNQTGALPATAISSCTRWSTHYGITRHWSPFESFVTRLLLWIDTVSTGHHEGWHNDGQREGLRQASLWLTQRDHGKQHLQWDKTTTLRTLKTLTL